MLALQPFDDVRELLDGLLLMLVAQLIQIDPNG
jgi:hypothetical protein